MRTESLSYSHVKSTPKSERGVYVQHASTHTVSIRKIEILFAFLLGMLFNTASLYTHYIVVLIGGILLSVVINILWKARAASLIILAAVLAANPANLVTSISINIIFMFFWLIFNINALKNLKFWHLWLLGIVFLSVIVSMANWQLAEGTVFTQFAAIGNYVVGPLFLIPLFYSQLKDGYTSKLLERILLWTLIIPSLLYLLLARTFGQVTVNLSGVFQEYGINVTVYRLGEVNFHMIRTQVGILLAVLTSICVSLFSSSSRTNRLIALFCLVTCIYLFMFTGSWGSILAATVSVIFISLLPLLTGLAFRQGFIAASLFAALVIGWNYLPDFVRNYFEFRFTESFVTRMTIFDRVGVWELAFQYLIDNPIGRGWNLWVAPIAAYPHNDYLVYGISFGILCGLAYLLMPIFILLLLIKESVRRNAVEPIYLAGISATLAFLINCSFDHLTANRWYFNVVWSIIWFCYYAARYRRGSEC